METEALALVQRHIDSGEWHWVSSVVLETESAQNQDADRRVLIEAILTRADHRVPFSALDEARLREVEAMGFTPFDAAHIVSAEVGKVDVLLTTDRALQKHAQRLANRLSVKIENPIDWLQGRTAQ